MYNNTQLQSFTNNILNMDCLNFMRECPDNYFDLVLTDPPYNLERYNKKDGGNSKKIQSFGDRDKKWNDFEVTEEYWDEIFRISKNQIIFGMNNFNLPKTEHFIVWDKGQKMPSFAECELAWSSCSTPAKIIRCRFETNKEHPAQKPLKLFQNILSDYSEEGQIILDCFSGSGTTAIACHNLNRNFICIEKDIDYYKASVERLNNAKAQLKLF